MTRLHQSRTSADTVVTRTSGASPRLVTLLLGAVLIATTCVVLGTAEATHYQILILALAAAAAIAVFVCLRPELFGIALVAMLLVPYTWSPTVRNSSTPIIVLFALPGGLAGAVTLILRGQLKLCILDYLVLAVFTSVLLSEIATLSATGVLAANTLSHDEFEIILLPYLAFRFILTAWPNIIAKLPNALMMTGAGLSLFAIWEELNNTNLLAHSSLNNSQLAVWEVNYPRAGAIRVDATMGHPIAFGSFLLIPIVFAFTQRRWPLFALLSIAEALTLSRGPYIAVIATLCLLGILTKRLGRLWVLLATIGIVALFIGPVRNSVTNSFQAGTREQRNANYRSELLGTSLNTLTLWGKPGGQTSELFGHQGRVTLADVTSEFSLLAGRQGLLGLVIWIGFLGAFVYTILEARKRSDPLLLSLGVILVGEWIALLSVALITSFECAFLLTLAMTATRLTIPSGTPRTAASHRRAQDARL